MIVCGACGKRAEDDDIFCPDCGARLDTSLKSQKEKRLYKKILSIILIFLFTIIAIGFITFISAGATKAFMPISFPFLLVFSIILIIAITLLWAFFRK